MNESEALYYPRSYYGDIALFFSNYITRLFAKDCMIYTFDRYDGWQSRLYSFIDQFLASTRLDDSVAIGALTLLERFRNTVARPPSYPHRIYLCYFVGAYMASHRLLAKSADADHLPFWLSVLGERFSPAELQHAEADFLRDIGYPDHIDSHDFKSMKQRMYLFIHTHMEMRSGHFYDREVFSQSLVSNRPPCYIEMMKRKALFTRIRSALPQSQELSNREFYKQLFQSEEL
ncbi:hypothetical protein JR316_0008079 [Psilocybe cubensis]|uniref:Uncharacterized protein n=2 Tax=Psilocybe cubensis TaxID=181762 RepID=A0A8H7XS26_PSICU|nr:hypothetical protein JR316_0008079 [Psilocybe cubensis]KAH9479485.1 hypothetical protein JR316_0008079 [Psilocybe cubensis]